MLGSAHPLARPGKTGDDARVVGIQSDMPMGFGHTQLDVWAVDPSNPHRRELLNRVNMDGEEFVWCDARNRVKPRDTAQHRMTRREISAQHQRPSAHFHKPYTSQYPVGVQNYSTTRGCLTSTLSD